MDTRHTMGPNCVSVISETPVTKVLLRNELNNHLPLSSFIHQTTSGRLLTRGGYLLALHKQLGAISRLRYPSESKTFIILSCQRSYFSKKNLNASQCLMQLWKRCIVVTRRFISLAFLVTFDKYCCLRQ